MPQEVQLPNGDIAEFPDDMAPDAIAQVLRRQFAPAPKPKALAPLPDLPKPANPIMKLESAAASAQQSLLSGDYGLESAMYAQEGQRLADRAAGVGSGLKALATGKDMNTRLGGASQAFREAGAAAGPYVVPAGVVGAAASGALPAFLANAAVGLVAQEGVDRGAKALGAGEGTARFAGDIAGLPSFIRAGKAVRPSAPRQATGEVFGDQFTGAPLTADEAAARVRAIGVENAQPQRDLNLPEGTAETGPAIPVPSAPEVASAGPVKPIPQNRDARRSSVLPVDDSVPEEVLRAQDRRERLSKDVFGKAFGDLSNPERLLIDEQLVQPAAAREPREFPPAIRSSRRNSQRGSFSEQSIAGPERPIEEEFFNFKRVKVSPEEEQHLRSTIRGMADSGDLAKTVEPHESIIQRAKEIDPDLVRFVDPKLGEGLDTRAAVLAMRQRINALTVERVRVQKEIGSGQLFDAPRKEAIAKLEALDKDLKEYLGSFAGIRTEAGRTLAALRIEADNTLDLDFWISKAARFKGLPKDRLPDAPRQKIIQTVGEAQEAAASGDAAAAAKAKIKLAKTAAQMQESGWWETATALWKAGLLTGAKTHLRNLGGNAAFQVAEEAMRIPSAITDMALSIHTGRRTVAGPSMRGIVNSTYEAATRGVSEAKQILTQGATAEDLVKGDMPRELNFQKLRNLVENRPDDALKSVLGKANDVVNVYANSVFRTLSAEDRIFRVYAMRRSIEAQAKVMAMNESRQGIIKPIDVQKRAIELSSNPTPIMQTEAIAYGEFATFNSKNAAADFVNRGKSALGPISKAGVDQILPFVSTPANVFSRLLDYAPGTNFIRPTEAAIAKYIEGNVNADVQKAFSEAVGRGMVGTAVVYLMYQLAREGKATGVTSETSGVRNVQTAAGRQSGAVKIGDSWLKVSPFSPIGTLATIGASLARESTRSLKDEAKRPWQVASVASRALLDQPMLQGVKDMIETLEQPGQRAESFMARRAGSFIPTAVSDIATVIDPTRREYKPPASSNPLVPMAHGVKQHLPFLRETLPEARDVLGRPLPASRTAAIDPFLSALARENRDSLMRELIGTESSIGSVRRITGEGDDHYRARSFLTGVVIESALRNLTLTGTAEQKKAAIKSAVRSARKDMQELLEDPSFIKTPEAQRAKAMSGMATQLQAKLPAPKP